MVRSEIAPSFQAARQTHQELFWRPSRAGADRRAYFAMPPLLWASAEVNSLRKREQATDSSLRHYVATTLDGAFMKARHENDQELSWGLTVKLRITTLFHSLAYWPSKSVTAADSSQSVQWLKGCPRNTISDRTCVPGGERIPRGGGPAGI